MKLSKREIYCLELQKEELLFLFEIIDKIKIDPNSPPAAVEIFNRFKKFRQAEMSSPACDGCGTEVDVLIQEDPVSKEKIPLCPSCIAHRNGYKSLLNEKSKASTDL